MRTTATFEFEDFSENFTLTDYDFEPEWPSLEVELCVKFHAAEPDVGINEPQPELIGTTYTFDGVTFSDENDVAEAFYAAHGDEIEETVEAVAKAIRDQVNDWVDEVEDDGS